MSKRCWWCGRHFEGPANKRFCRASHKVSACTARTKWKRLVGVEDDAPTGFIARLPMAVQLEAARLVQPVGFAACDVSIRTRARGEGDYLALNAGATLLSLSATWVRAEHPVVRSAGWTQLRQATIVLRGCQRSKLVRSSAGSLLAQLEELGSQLLAKVPSARTWRDVDAGVWS